MRFASDPRLTGTWTKAKGWVRMNAQELWEWLVARLEEDVDADILAVYFLHTRATSFAGDRLRVEVTNRYYLEWVKDNYLSLLQGYAQQRFGRPIAVELVAAEEHGEAAGTTAVPATRTTLVQASQTFETFVVGPCNEFAHAAAQAVCDKPGGKYNPLYLFGASGLGKTHLLHAIGNEIARRQPGTQLLYLTTEDFTNDLVNAIRWKRTEQFRSRFRAANAVLLLDDVQFLSGRARTQEELFHTFNALQSVGCQIVLTSDQEPQDVVGLEPRLVTRFAGGLVADLQAPDPETLLAILHNLAERTGTHLPHDLASALASQAHGSIREVSGLFNRLQKLAEVKEVPLTLEFARTSLPDLFAPAPRQVSVAMIIEAVARVHNLRSADITGQGRSRTLTRPRQIAMHLARKHTALSYPELAREFGGRDHTTIVYGVQKVETDLQRDPDLAFQVHLLEQNLGLRTR